MKKKPFVWVVLGSALFFLCIIVPSLSGSLWFLRELLGDRIDGYTVGYVSTFIDSNEMLEGVREKNAALLPDSTNKYNRFVYKKDQEGEYLVGIPKISSQFSLIRELQAASWHTERVAWVVYARRSYSNTELSAQEVHLFRAIGDTVAGIFWQRLPAFPRLIVQTIDAKTDPMALYVEEKGQGVHGVVSTNSINFRHGTRTRVSADTLVAETSYVSVQRDILQLLPIGIATSLENKVSELMHFTKTRPEILKNLLSFAPSLVLAQHGDFFAIGLSSTDDRAAKLIHAWIGEEQGTRHPQRRAFSLPDKTLGYEYIPGVSNAYFSLNKAKNNCLPSEEYDEHIFLCAKDSVLVLSNNEELGSNFLISLEDPMMFQKGVIQAETLNTTGLGAQFEKLEYVVRDEMIEFWADKKLQ